VDKLTSTTVICQGGLDTTRNHLLLDAQFPGTGVELVNYEVGLFGGYKRIDGYTVLDEDFAEVADATTEGPVLGIFIFQNTIIAARKLSASANYRFYEFQAGVGWTLLVTGGTHVSTGVVTIRHLIWTFGDTEYIAFVDGVNPLTIYDGTTWYQADSGGAGTELDPGGNQMIDAPSYIEFFNNTIFISGDAAFPGIVAHSAPEDVFDWTAASGGGQILSGFNVNALKTFRENLYVFGRERIRKIVIDGTDFVIRDVANNIGNIAEDSVLELNGDILFLAQDGIRTVSGTEKIGDVNLASISKQIQRLVNDLQVSYDLGYLRSVVIKKKSQFRYFVSSGSIDNIGVGIIGGLRGTGDSTGMEYSELQGIRAACVVSGYLNNQEVILHGDFDGIVYQQESGNTFNGSSVYSNYTTPYLTFGDILTRKQLRKLHVFTQYEGLFTLSAKFSFDWGDANSLTPSTFSEDSIGAGTSFYDTGDTYDSGVLYGSDEYYPVLDYNVSGTFKSIRIAFTTSGDNYPHTIQGLVFDFTPQGKR
jgi:hypothetical protein